MRPLSPRLCKSFGHMLLENGLGALRLRRRCNELGGLGASWRYGCHGSSSELSGLTVHWRRLAALHVRTIKTWIERQLSIALKHREAQCATYMTPQSSHSRQGFHPSLFAQISHLLPIPMPNALPKSSSNALHPPKYEVEASAWTPP